MVGKISPLEPKKRKEIELNTNQNTTSVRIQVAFNAKKILDLIN